VRAELRERMSGTTQWRRITKAVEQVLEGQPRMAPEHTWPAVTHDGLNGFPLGRAITMDGAIRAGGLGGAVRATSEPAFGIVQ
jgi:hypothetical protein